jgi:hypothetical protein
MRVPLYDSGRDHGCVDARISDPEDRYINEPGKEPSFHTEEFMAGHNAGLTLKHCNTTIGRECLGLRLGLTWLTGAMDVYPLLVYRVSI